MSALSSSDLVDFLRVAERAADRAREETLSRFRSVEVEWKEDGSPVTEADRAAERAIREVLGEATPDFGLLGEEYGEEETGAKDAPRWIVDPIDGTVSYSRGLPFYSTLIALVADGRSVLGLIDLPALGERYTGTAGGGCRRNGTPVSVSQRSDPKRAIVSHGDPICFEKGGEPAAWQRMASELPFLRGYTDAFGHAQVLSGGVDAMVDLDLAAWDAAASEVLVVEAGGRCATHRQANGKLSMVLGSPPLVEHLLGYFDWAD